MTIDKFLEERAKKEVERIKQFRLVWEQAERAEVVEAFGDDPDFLDQLDDFDYAQWNSFFSEAFGSWPLYYVDKAGKVHPTD